MVAVAQDDNWSERALLTIQPIGGTALNFGLITETIDIDEGDKPLDIKAMISGGRLVGYKPKEPTEVTFEAYPLAVGTASGATIGLGFFDLFNTGAPTSTLPFVTTTDFTRTKVRLAMLWTNDPTPFVTQQADVATATNYSALRLSYAEARITSVKPSFTDGVLKFKVKATIAPFDKSAVSNFRPESCAGTTATDKLSALNAYTTTNKF